MKYKKHTDDGYTDIYVNNPYIGKSNTDVSMPQVENFIKNEIVLLKTCACPRCNYRRKMFRAIQYIIEDYKKIKKDNK